MARELYDLLVLPGAEITQNHIRAHHNTHIVALNLTDYISADEHLVTCPNQDTVYGACFQHVDTLPVVIQVPDFGNRFFVYQLADARTSSFGGIGKQYGTIPGFYAIVGPNWRVTIPNRICRSRDGVGFPYRVVGVTGLYRQGEFHCSRARASECARQAGSIARRYQSIPMCRQYLRVIGAQPAIWCHVSVASEDLCK